MNFSKARFLLLGVSVLSLGIILGTFFWLKLAPRPGLTGWDAKPLEGLSRYGSVPEFSLHRAERQDHHSGRPPGIDLDRRLYLHDLPRHLPDANRGDGEAPGAMER